MVYVRNTIRVHMMYPKGGGVYQKIVLATTSQVQNAPLPSRRESPHTYEYHHFDDMVACVMEQHNQAHVSCIFIIHFRVCTNQLMNFYLFLCLKKSTYKLFFSVFLCFSR